MKNDGIKYPSRFRVFLGFLGIALVSLISKKNSNRAATILALGISEIDRVENQNSSGDLPKT